MNVQDLITDIFLLMGVYNQGDGPNPSEQAQGLLAINRRLDQWNSRSTYIFQTVELGMTLQAGQQDYLIGTGAADLNTVRPLIRHMRVKLANSAVALPVELIGSAEWNAIEELSLTGERPQKAYCDYGWPVAKLRFWPKPSLTMAAFLQAWQRLTKFAAVTDTIDFPDGYLLPLEFQVALDLVPSFQQQIQPAALQIIAQGAATAQADIQNLNADLLRGVAKGPVPEMTNATPMPNLQPQPGAGTQ